MERGLARMGRMNTDKKGIVGYKKRMEIGQTEMKLPGKPFNPISALIRFIRAPRSGVRVPFLLRE
jgi:hypothetical protein